MENKLLKVIVVTEDGEQKEFEGEGIVAYAITDTGDQTRAHGGVIGKFDDRCVNALIACLEESFEERWTRVDMMRKMKRLLGLKDGEEYMEVARKAAEKN